ncbi:MAG: hypothetical protein HIU83_02915, partial [Proteobacteria bacterium]|nr:hypothetical protein [Pseudomonadota bacterium]
MKSYYTARELSGMPGMPSTESAVIRRAKKDQWPSQNRAGRGGGREYSFAALPPETRQHLEQRATASINTQSETAVAIRTEGATPAIEIETPELPSMTTLKSWQVGTMDARMIFMRLIEKAEPVIGATKAIRTIATQASHGELPAELNPFAKAANKRGGDDTSNRTLSERTLWRWWTDWTRSGKKAVVLAPNLGRDHDGHIVSAGSTEIPAWAPAFLAAYRVPQKISVAEAIGRMKLADGMKRPSISQAYRFIEKYSKLDIERGRKSSKELLSQRSYCERDTSKFYPGDIRTTETIKLDLPPYSTAEISITINYPGGAAKCGEIVVGMHVDIGDTQYSPSIGIVDYSDKTVDSFGNYSPLERDYLYQHLWHITELVISQAESSHPRIPLNLCELLLWVVVVAAT